MSLVIVIIMTVAAGWMKIRNSFIAKNASFQDAFLYARNF